ncbi:aspartyl-phosphate phosphatase Spo0E family protein [Romboutsia ilealis]|uniref:Aspartyl-phosphate phosphatase Spo0E family protein n=1 Tax=Romboutsia faecis TaxID=2764597 RepID=A0ABR7JTS0_9FIRM|nr:aspartyl-phosphate phosphatase Spo0E family protein [Romboutsia faecis]MBC5998312.1 aspartyl-phosphate phosphatase Spo0E family protein [Romboutsia faecis]MRN25968.1 aspartyl-phosphate phosphatase Spo0E family protein [Romboutsia ilealis]
MGELKNKLNELIEEYGLRHEKVLVYSQELDRYIALEQKERLKKYKSEGLKKYKSEGLKKYKSEGLKK